LKSRAHTGLKIENAEEKIVFRLLGLSSTVNRHHIFVSCQPPGYDSTVAATSNICSSAVPSQPLA
jgi:hypothetical protein